MKLKHLLLITAGVSVLSGIRAQAQEQDHEFADNRLDLSAQFRPRFEYREGDFTPIAKDQKPAALVSNRLRLTLDYSYKDQIETRFTAQNLSIWGQASPTQTVNSRSNNLGFFEAWVDLKIYRGLRTRIGRQAILLDDQRLFSIADWTQGGRTHDALSVYYTGKKFELKTFFAFNQNYDALYNNNLNNPSGNYYVADGAQAYKHMQVLWMGYQLSKVSKLSYIFANVGYQKTDPSVPAKIYNSDLQTTGLNYFLTKDNYDVKLTGYYQFGRNAQNQKASAYLLSAGINGKMDSKWILGARIDYLSGSKSDLPGDKTHGFFPLFTTPHPFYGQMDYYPVSDLGLWNNVITLKYIASEKVNLQAEWHDFLSPHKFIRNGEEYGTNLGQEVDLNMNYSINPFTSLSVGYSVYFKTKSLLAAKGVNDPKSWQQWAWVSLNVTPKFLRTRF